MSFLRHFFLNAVFLLIHQALPLFTSILFTFICCLRRVGIPVLSMLTGSLFYLFLHFDVFQFQKSFYPHHLHLNYIRSKPSIPIYSVLNFVLPCPAVLFLTACFAYTYKLFLHSELLRQFTFSSLLCFKKQYPTLSNTDSFRSGCSYHNERKG